MTLPDLSRNLRTDVSQSCSTAGGDYGRGSAGRRAVHVDGGCGPSHGLGGRAVEQVLWQEEAQGPGGPSSASGQLQEIQINLNVSVGKIVLEAMERLILRELLL